MTLPLLPSLLLPLLLLTGRQQEGLARQWRTQQPSDQLHPLPVACGRLAIADAATAVAALLPAASGWREVPEDEGFRASAAATRLDRSGLARSLLALARNGVTTPVRLQVRLRACPAAQHAASKASPSNRSSASGALHERLTRRSAHPIAAALVQLLGAPPRLSQSDRAWRGALSRVGSNEQRAEPAATRSLGSDAPPLTTRWTTA